MADLKRHSDPVWERFFEFVFPCDEEMTRAEVQDDLKRLGISVNKAVSRLQQALEASKGRAELATARAKRLGIVARLGKVVAPAVQGLRERLKELIAGKMQGELQAAYFRKLETAATDEDLQSLFEDIHRLEALSEEPDGDNPEA